MSKYEYDVFLSHNIADKPAVEAIARRLRELAHLEPFLDKWHLVPGEPWQEALEEAIDTSRSCAVFLGPAGMGSWENEEMRAALDIRVRQPAFRVIPVLLPGASLPERGRLPRFLSRLTWVDFRPGLDDPDAFHRLVCGIQGIAPGPEGVTEGEAVCPFRGLQVFDEEHAPFFFGREALTQHLVEQLRSDRFLAVIGPSGSGKSSLVRAGLLPQVRTGTLPASDRWPVVLFQPGPHPIETLAARLLPHLGESADPLAARQSLLNTLAKDESGLHTTVQVALASAPDSLRLLMVVDQFEELFTLCRNEQARTDFIANLLYASAIAGGQTVAVVTMRADFFGKCATFSNLATRLAERDVLVGPMSEEELRRAMESPAEAVGLHYEKGLVETILDDLGDEPGSLPLLEHTLLELWERRRGGWLTVDAYHEIGGVKGALAQRADEVYAGLTQEQQAAARRVLLRLTQPGEGTEDTRRRAALAELLPAEGEATDVETAVQELADARLLTTGEDEQGAEVVDVAHEALIRGWPRLRKWIDEDRELLRMHRQLTEAAEEWRAYGEDEDFLYRGGRLAAVEEWLTERPDDLNPEEQSYIQESVALRERENKARERLRQRLTLIAVGAAGVFLALAASTGVGWWRAEERRREAEEQRRFAEIRLAQQLAAQAQMVSDSTGSSLVQSVLLAVESLRLYPTLTGEQVLGEGLVLLHRPVARMEHEWEVWAVAFSPDGHWVASGSGDRTVRVWEAATGKEVARMGHKDWVESVVFSPDGRWVASGSHDNTVQVWEAATGREVARMEHDGGVWAVVFSPDGRWVVSGSHDDTVRVWEAATGREVARMVHGGWVETVAFSSDGQRIVSGSEDNTVRVWEAATGKEIARMEHKGWVQAVAFSPDGRWVASGSWDNTVRVWEVATGREVARMVHEGWVETVAFSSDGQRIVSGSKDGTVRVWEAVTGKGIARMEHSGSVQAVAFSPDGRWVASASKDSTVRVWETATGKEGARLVHEGSVNAVTFSPDGRWVASASEDSTVRIWEAIGGEEAVRMEHEDWVVVVDVSPDGQRVASASWDHTARVWDVATGQEVARMEHEENVHTLAFSSDGQWIASGSGDPDTGAGAEVRVWEAATGREVTRMEQEGWVRDVAFSPDGRWVASGGGDKTARVWEAATGKEVARFVHNDDVVTVAFSPNGQWIVSSSDDHTARVWDVTTGQEVARVTHKDWVRDVAFSPDGQWIVSGSGGRVNPGGEVWIWEAATGRKVAEMSHEDNVVAVAFSPDGRWIASGSLDYTARIWEAATGQEVARIEHEGAVNDVTFSPDGRWIASVGQDGMVRVSDVTTGEEMARLEHNVGEVWTVAFSPDGQWIVSGSGSGDPHYERAGDVRIWAWKLEDRILEACTRLPRNLTLEEWRWYLGNNEPYSPTCPNLPVLEN